MEQELLNNGDVMDPKISLREYINKLEALALLHGDSVPVEKWSASRGRHMAPPPHEAYRRIPIGGRRHSDRDAAPQFWNEHDPLEAKGRLVIRV